MLRLDRVRAMIRRSAAALMLLAAAACSGDHRTPLIVYSPHDKDLLTYFQQAFEAAHPDVDVQWVDMGSQDILDRLRSEKANPQADVWFGAPAETFNRGAAEGLIDGYRPSWAAAVPPEAHDPSDRWYGTYMTPEVIAYNTDIVSAAQAPQDWDDVLAPRWKGTIIIRDPVASGSMRAIWAAILSRSIAHTGSTAQGWAWLRRLDASTKEYVINPTMLYLKLGQREGSISLWDMPDIATLQQQKKYPLAYVIPASGTPLLVDAIAIVHGAKHAAAAKAFYEFVTTPRALEDAAVKFLRIPVRTDLPADSLPAWIRDARAKIRPMPLDPKLIADSLDAWMKYWDANVRNCCRGQ
ncbi:MAG TPA: extracellular solute-binding protein [Gemmatimonadaceae bacterium]|nr:extracellular solute-binding protein [Gemmatimonadaceae bacterium]